MIMQYIKNIMHSFVIQYWDILIIIQQIMMKLIMKTNTSIKATINV
jgi:hypothetical protein